MPRGLRAQRTVLFAEPLFNAAVAEQLGLAVIEPPEDFLIKLPREYAARDSYLITAAETRTLPGPVFLKPPNQKTFPARVYASGTEFPEMPDDNPVLASEPFEWIAEFHDFVRDRWVHAWSLYWQDGALAKSGDDWVLEPEMATTTRGLADRPLNNICVHLMHALILDAGVIRGVGPAVVEENVASGAGSYGCDPRDVREGLRAATVVNPGT